MFCNLCFTSAVIRDDLMIVQSTLECILVKAMSKIRINSWCSSPLFTHIFTFSEKLSKPGFVFYKARRLHLYIMPVRVFRDLNP